MTTTSTIDLDNGYRAEIGYWGGYRYHWRAMVRQGERFIGYTKFCRSATRAADAARELAEEDDQSRR